MDRKEQDEIKKHFDRMHLTGILPWKHHPPEPALAYFLSYLKDNMPEAKLLDIGCGDGWITIKAAKTSFESWGIDGSETAISHAKQAAAEENVQEKVHFRVGDALALPYDPDFFDALIDRGLFHHILPENRSLYLENILRVLKQNSFMYLAVFGKNNPEGIGQRFSQADIESIFGSVFSLIYSKEDPSETDAPAHLLHFILKRKQQ